MDSSILTEVGLTKKESEVYMALTEWGSSSASSIIQKTGFHRAVVYDLLERLIEKGLAGYVIKGRKKFFEATNPTRLLEILKEKEEKIVSILPRLTELSQFKEHLNVKIYKGKEGIKAVLEDILKAKPKEWLVIGSAGETYNLLPAYLDNFQKKRIKSKINVKALFINSIKAKRRKEEISKMRLTEARFLPKTFLTPTVMNLYNNQVILYSVTEDKIPFIILIENRQLTNSFREYFEWLWKLSRS